MGGGLLSALVQLGGQDYHTSQCTTKLAVLPHMEAALKALQLTEALRAVLESQVTEEEQDSLRKRVSNDTAHIITRWLEGNAVSTASKGEGLQHLDMDGWQKVAVLLM